MANFHVVPRGDAIQHVLSGNTCPCAVEVRTISSDERPGAIDVWYYHRTVTLTEAVASAGEAQVEPEPEVA